MARSGNGTAGLLDEKAFAKLIASDKHFGRAVTAKQICDFPVLKYALRLEWAGGRNQFQMLSVQNTVAMEDRGLARMEDGENNSAVAHERRNPRGKFVHEVGIEVVQNVPEQHCIERAIGIQHCALEKPLRKPTWRELGSVRPGWKLLHPLLFLDEKVLQGGQQILGVDLEASIDEQSDCGLPGLPKIQQMAASNSIKLPEKFL